MGDVTAVHLESARFAAEAAWTHARAVRDEAWMKLRAAADENGPTELRRALGKAWEQADELVTLTAAGLQQFEQAVKLAAERRVVTNPLRSDSIPTEG